VLEKHCPHLSNIVNASTHRLSFWHSVVCPSDSAHSRQKVIIPELDFLHGPSSNLGHPGPGLHLITLSPLMSAGNSKPFRQYSPSSSLLSNGHEYPQPPSSIGGISTANVKACFPRSYPVPRATKRTRIFITIGIVPFPFARKFSKSIFIWLRLHRPPRLCLPSAKYCPHHLAVENDRSLHVSPPDTVICGLLSMYCRC